MSAKDVDDQVAHLYLKRIAAGRSKSEMTALAFVAHEEFAWGNERAKHDLIPKGPDPQSGTWGPLQDYVLDGEGTNQVDVALGLALKALLLGDVDDFNFKARALVKACDVALPHVRQKIIDEIVTSGAVNAHFPARLLPPNPKAGGNQ